MKKVILIFVAIVFATGAFAQTAEETITWLNAKFALYKGQNPNSITALDTELLLPHAYTSSDRNYPISSYFLISYKEITAISSSEKYISITTKDNVRFYDTRFDSHTSDREASKRLSTHTIYINNSDDIKKIVNALKHLAELKGATLIDETMFDN